MNCPNCGAKNSETAAYCLLCYARFGHEGSGSSKGEEADNYRRVQNGRSHEPVPDEDKILELVEREKWIYENSTNDELARFDIFLRTGQVREQYPAAKRIKYLMYAIILILCMASVAFALWGTSSRRSQIEAIGKIRGHMTSPGIGTNDPSSSVENADEKNIAPIPNYGLGQAGEVYATAMLHQGVMSVMVYGAENDYDFSNLNADVMNEKYKSSNEFNEGSPKSVEASGKIFIEEKGINYFKLSVISHSGKVHVASFRDGSVEYATP